MDAAWWQEYDELYSQCATTISRLMELDVSPLNIDEVYQFGSFLGMTSRIKDTFGRKEGCDASPDTHRPV